MNGEGSREDLKYFELQWLERHAVSSDEIFSYIDSNEKGFVDKVVRLCKQPSISAQDVGIEECANLLAEMMEESGLKARVLREKSMNPVVLGELNMEAHSTILFYNHYDVQPVDPVELWKTDPFSPDIRDGCIFARGAADTKGNIAARLSAIETFLNLYGEIPCNVKFLVEGEEEIGSPGLSRFVDSHKTYLRADGCMWESGYKDLADRPTITLGAKGIIFLELSAKGPSRDLHSSMATLVPNPAWTLVRLFSTLKDEEGMILVENFYKDVQPPTEQDLENLKRIEFDEEKVRANYGIEEFNAGLTGVEAKVRHFFHPTCNIAGIVSGYTGKGGKTVLPSVATAKLDIRLVPNQRPQDIVEKLRRHVESKGFRNVEMKVHEAYEPARTPMDSQMAKLAADTGRLVYGVEPVIYPTMAGSGPMYLFTKTLGLQTAGVGVGHFNSNTHSPNENIRVKDFLDGTKQVAMMMLNFHSYL